MCRRNIARSFGSFATPIVATTRVYDCLPTFSQLSCGNTYCQSEAIRSLEHLSHTNDSIIAEYEDHARKSNPDVLMVQTSEVWGWHDTANGLHSTRRWCILVQR